MTLTFERDLDSVKVKHRVKYLGHMSVHSKIIVQTCTRWHTEQTHRWWSLYTGNDDNDINDDYEDGEPTHSALCLSCAV